MSKPVVLTSSVREVTVYRAGAIVTRVAELSDEWPETVVFDGLPLALDDESVRVSLRAGGEGPRPADVRAELATPPAEGLGTPPAPGELEACEKRAAELRRMIERVNAELGQLRRIALDLPEPREDSAPSPAPTAAWQGTLDWLAEAKRARWQERNGLDQELRDCEEQQARLRRREDEARALRDARADAVSKRVVLRLRGPRGSGPGELRLEYQVPGARWVPSYVLRMARDGRSADLSLRAHVVQASGEPWERVQLSLSTADLRRETQLPELQSLRIGRRQPAPVKLAWREPPTGAETLFAGLDRALSRRPGAPPPPPMPQPLPVPSMAPDLFDSSEDLSSLVASGMADRMDAFGSMPEAEMLVDEREQVKAKKSGKGRRRSAPPPRPQAAFAMPASAPAPSRMMRGGPPGGAGGAAPMRDEPAPEPEPMGLEPEAGLMRYGDLVLGRWDHPGYQRGKLRVTGWEDRLEGLDPAQKNTIARRVREAQDRARGTRTLVLPSGTVDVAGSSGDYAYRYDAEGRIDVPCDGTLHNVPLFSRAAPVETTLVVVPRESDQAVRVARLENPLEAPLLAGPAEVYLEDEFLVTTGLHTVPLRGRIEVGLGVEESLKVARNAHMREESHGLLGGGRSLIHSVKIELASRLSAATAVEVRERVPVKADDDEDLEIVDVSCEPKWERFVQDETRPLEGGHRWRFELGPGEERELTFAYTIKIDAKNELVGGNRREAR